MANLCGPFGVEGAIAIVKTFDAETIDAMIFAWNERQIPDDVRVQNYIKRCHAQRAGQTEKEKALQLMEQIGAKEGDRVIVIG